MNYLKTSKFISLILRHKPEKVNIELDEFGWCNTKELLEKLNDNKFPITMEELETLVRNDDKQRFSFNEDKSKIRANQGHSIAVNLNLIPIEPPAVLYHGTAEKYIDSIMESGIEKCSRQYVHLSKDIETASKVGKRHGKLVILEIDSKKMFQDGYKFYLSENKVWLCDYIPTKYIKIALQS